MNKPLRAISLAVVSAALLLFASCGGSDAGGGGEDGQPSAVVFVGASITDGWDFDACFPGRAFAKVIHYDADKTQVWDEIDGHSPRIVVVKECAGYFYAEGGTPIGDHEGIMAGMTALIRGIGAVPVLATTIPVDVGDSGCTLEQLADIIAFNAWVRAYCASEGIVCLDLAAAVSDSEGQLPTSCHDGDGLHPNEAGYNALTAVVIPALEAAGL